MELNLLLILMKIWKGEIDKLYKILYSETNYIKAYPKEVIQKYKMQEVRDYIVSMRSDPEPANIIKKLSEIVKFGHPWFKAYYQFQLFIYNYDHTNPLVDAVFLENSRKLGLVNLGHLIFPPITFIGKARMKVKP